MNGFELSKGYYEEYGKPLLEGEFSYLLPYLAIGFTGSGSEHYGFDDAISRDHDYEPGFCIFLPGEDVVSRRDAFLLERAYYKLPKEYCGVKKPLLAPVGGPRHGVFRTAEYYLKAVGASDGYLSDEAWLTIPDYVLAEAVNGVIFRDDYGEVSKIRETLRRMPEDVLRKRLAGNLLLAGQSGQYNFTRTMSHGEPEAAAMALQEFVNASLKVIYLLNGSYMPYYKWSFRGLAGLKEGAEYKEKLAFLLFGDHRETVIFKKKLETVEWISGKIIAELKERGLSDTEGPDLERHAYAVNNGISDNSIRNLNILATV